MRARQSARAGEAKRAEAESSSFLESVKAKLTPAEVVEIRRLAERYVDETDDIEYFAGKTREEQMKELEATQRADVEARVRDLLGDGRGYGPSSVPARSTSADDAFFQTGVKHLKLADDVGGGIVRVGDDQGRRVGFVQLYESIQGDGRRRLRRRHGFAPLGAVDR